jgi:hypothetical protein
VSPELSDRVDAYCAAKGLKESALVKAALTQYLDGTGDAALVLRRLDRLGRALARVHRDLELVCEGFSVFVRLWLAHTPEVPEEGRRTARMSAESRYKRFVEHVSEQFSGGKRFLDDLPREVVADQEELSKLAGGGTG